MAKISEHCCQSLLNLDARSPSWYCVKLMNSFCILLEGRLLSSSCSSQLLPPFPTPYIPCDSAWLSCSYRTRFSFSSSSLAYLYSLGLKTLCLRMAMRSLMLSSVSLRLASRSVVTLSLGRSSTRGSCLTSSPLLPLRLYLKSFGFLLCRSSSGRRCSSLDSFTFSFMTCRWASALSLRSSRLCPVSSAARLSSSPSSCERRPSYIFRLRRCFPSSRSCSFCTRSMNQRALRPSCTSSQIPSVRTRRPTGSLFLAGMAGSLYSQCLDCWDRRKRRSLDTRWISFLFSTTSANSLKAGRSLALRCDCSSWLTRYWISASFCFTIASLSLDGPVGCSATDALRQWVAYQWRWLLVLAARSLSRSLLQLQRNSRCSLQICSLESAGALLCREMLACSRQATLCICGLSGGDCC